MIRPAQGSLASPLSALNEYSTLKVAAFAPSSGTRIASAAATIKTDLQKKSCARIDRSLELGGADVSSLKTPCCTARLGCCAAKTRPTPRTGAGTCKARLQSERRGAF